MHGLHGIALVVCTAVPGTVLQQLDLDVIHGESLAVHLTAGEVLHHIMWEVHEDVAHHWCLCCASKYSGVEHLVKVALDHCTDQC